jgi:hypothetical protein
MSFLQKPNGGDNFSYIFFRGQFWGQFCGKSPPKMSGEKKTIFCGKSFEKSFSQEIPRKKMSEKLAPV